LKLFGLSKVVDVLILIIIDLILSIVSSLLILGSYSVFLISVKMLNNSFASSICGIRNIIGDIFEIENHNLLYCLKLYNKLYF